MHRLIHIAMALLLGLLIAATPGSREAAAQDRTRPLPQGFNQNIGDSLIAIFFPRNSAQRGPNSKDAAAAQQTRQGNGRPAEPNGLTELIRAFRSDLNKYLSLRRPPPAGKSRTQKRRDARKRPPPKNDPWAFLIADLTVLSGQPIRFDEVLREHRERFPDDRLIDIFSQNRRGARTRPPIAPPVFLLDPDPRIGLPDETIRIMGGDGAGADAD